MTENTGSARSALRDKIFSSPKMKIKTKIIDFFGADVEIRQPTLESIMGAKNENPDDNQGALMRSLMDNCYVPGTEEKVFEEGDYATISAMPFGADIQRAMETIGELSDANFTKKNKSSDETPGDSTSKDSAGNSSETSLTS